MGMICSKRGSTEILSGVPIGSGVDNLSAVPVSALAYRTPDARFFKGPASHPVLARICGACGFAELYLQGPKGLAAMVKRDIEDV